MMRFTHFLTFRDGGAVTDAERAALAALLASTNTLASARIYLPTTTHDPYLDDGKPPSLVVQCYFAELQHLEAAFAKNGPLQALATPALLPSQKGAAIVQEALAARHYPVPDKIFQTPDGAPHCTYLVSYVGPAQDINAWLTHYIAHHPPIMARFPGIRQIEIYSRLDWTGALAVPRFAHMQRNKVVFDSADALTAALNSPVRHEMRSDFHEFPPYEGGNTHYPMLTWTVAGAQE